MKYDFIIIGGGPAGLTAAIYAVRRNLKTLVIEKGLFGGQMNLTLEIGNWPGYDSISGSELSEKMRAHAEKLNVEFLQEEATKLSLKDETKTVEAGGRKYECKTLLIATGGEHRKLGAKGEAEFAGRGVSYCATCDGPFFRGKTVVVVGGGNAAVEDALYLAGLARKVYLVHRRSQLRAEETRQKELGRRNVELVLEATVEEISGSHLVDKVRLNQKGRSVELHVDGVFISVGTEPNSKLSAEAGVEADEKGFIKVNGSQETNIPGVYAAGDVTGGALQIATAVGGGCVAALRAYDYINKPYWSRR